MTTAVTGEPAEPSQFDPHLTDEDIEALEVRCVTRDGHLIKDQCHKRTYWIEADSEIGASEGEKTKCLYVEYLNSGTLHGYPLSRKQLKKKQKGAGQ